MVLFNFFCLHQKNELFIKDIEFTLLHMHKKVITMMEKKSNK